MTGALDLGIAACVGAATYTGAVFAISRLADHLYAPPAASDPHPLTEAEREWVDRMAGPEAFNRYFDVIAGRAFVRYLDKGDNGDRADLVVLRTTRPRLKSKIVDLTRTSETDTGSANAEAYRPDAPC